MVKAKQAIDKINDKLKKGEISTGRAKVLKGAVILGSGLEELVGKVPVVGKAAGWLVGKVWGTTMKLNGVKAERSTKLEAIFEDPENADTDGVSGY